MENFHRKIKMLISVAFIFNNILYNRLYILVLNLHPDLLDCVINKFRTFSIDLSTFFIKQNAVSLTRKFRSTYHDFFHVT